VDFFRTDSSPEKTTIDYEPRTGSHDSLSRPREMIALHAHEPEEGAFTVAGASKHGQSRLATRSGKGGTHFSPNCCTANMQNESSMTSQVENGALDYETCPAR
jgi:hypothetical protein